MRRRTRRPPKPIEPWNGPKPKLRMLVTHQYRVHYLDLQAYLAKVYRTENYDILGAAGITNRVVPEFWVTGQMPPASNVGQQADDIRRGRSARSLGLILNVLCADGFIPAGKYVIDTSDLPDPIHAYTALLNEHVDPNHPDCVAFKKKHRAPAFQRRAKTLDQLAAEYRRQLEDA